jgi:iron complex outermembrane recepter protein
MAHRLNAGIRAALDGRAFKHAARLLAGAALIALATPTAAGAQAPAAGDPAAAETRAFNIPAQPLAGALNVFGRQAGLQVTGDGAVAAGAQGQAVSGRLTPDEALARLLAGTGVTWRKSDAKTVLLVKAPKADGAELLDPVNVDGAAETAKGPVKGYVATRSATATKTDTPLLETPQSISVVTRDQMEAQGALRLEQALRYTPGVTTEWAIDNRNDSYWLRGLSATAYLDGLTLRGGTYASWKIDPYALERVEVLRGPSSVLYGQNAPGGLINQVSKRPTASPINEAQISIGSFDYRQAAADIGGALTADGKLLGRLVSVARDSESQVDFAEDDRLLLAPSITWKPSSATTLTLLGHVQRDRTDSTVGFLKKEGTVLANPNGKIPSNRFAGEPNFEQFDTDQAALGYELEHHLDDGVILRQNARLSRIDMKYKTVYVSSYLADMRTMRRLAALSDSATVIGQIDNQAQFRFVHGPVEHTLLAGFDHLSSRNSEIYGVGAAPNIDIYNPVYGAAVTTPAISVSRVQRLSQTGLYAQDQIKFDKRWALTLGGRQDWATARYVNRFAGTTAKRDDSAFTGRAGLAYLSDLGVTPYVSYSQSFLPVSTADAAGRILEPETGRQFEAGVKYQPPGGESYVAAALFDLKRRNVVTYDLITFAPTQTGEVRSRGAELEVKLNLLKDFDLLAAYTYQDVEVTKSTAADLGKRPPTIPEQTASLWADYKFADGPLAGLGLGAGVRHTGFTYGDTRNTYKVPGYTLADASVHYDWGDTRLALNANNLFDKEYVASCWGSCYFGARRTVVATLRHRW